MNKFQRVLDNSDYISTIKKMDPDTATSGTAWLAAIVDKVHETIIEKIPGIKHNLS
jgi:hypothetical protein